MMRQMIIYESILDDLENGGSADAARNIAHKREELKDPDVPGWQNLFRIRLPLTISQDCNEQSTPVQWAIRSKECIEEVLQNTLWVTEYSEVWICSVPIGNDLVFGNNVVHATDKGGHSYMMFSINGRPRNTREVLHFMMSIIQSVRPAYDEKSEYSNSDEEFRVMYRDERVVGDYNFTTFEYYDEFYFLMHKKTFLYEWTREGSKGNYPWTIFRRLLGFITAIMPGTAEPYYRLKKMFSAVVDEMNTEDYELTSAESELCEGRYSYSPGRPGEIKLSKNFKTFFTTNPINTSRLEYSEDFRIFGFCLICPTERKDTIENSTVYSFGQPFKKRDNFICEEHVGYILSQCDDVVPKKAWLKLFKKSHSIFIVLYIGTFVVDNEYGPVDAYVGVRTLIDEKNYDVFADELCNSLNLLYDNKLPSEFQEYVLETIKNKY